MTVKTLHGPDEAPMDILRDRCVAVIGYGNQGRAHALNMRETGLEIVVGARREGAGFRSARDDGFLPRPIAQAVAGADLVILALPDEVQPEAYRDDVAPRLGPGATVGFLHGFNIRYGFIRPAEGIGVVMVAPKGPGATLRALYEKGLGLPALFAVHQESVRGDAEAVGLAWAGAIGSARAAIVCTSFAQETETDLFGEQSVLCGGLTGLVRAAFDIMVEAGYPPELAYLECCHEVKQVADLVYERGLAGMYEAISTTAEFGAYRAAPLLIDDATRDRMRALLAAIRDGSFARDLSRDHESGAPEMTAQREAARALALEPAGAFVRALMPWLGKPSEGERRTPDT